ncbi:MAG: RNase adaptor protein RapZ, partial [Flavobacteriia bacterium]
MLRKDIFGGSQQPDNTDRTNRIIAGTEINGDLTSDTNIHQLRRQVWKCIGADNEAMTIVLESFAFKRGVPQDVDFIFDARILPNPHWIETLREH